MHRAASTVGRLLGRLAQRDRDELGILLLAIVILGLVLAFGMLAGKVLEGDTQQFDERVLAALRQPENPQLPLGPRWLHGVALDITALGSAVVLGLTVLAVCGFLALQGLRRYAAFVFVASVGGWVVNATLKAIFSRPRPDIVPHLRDVMTMSFPSGHALTSAAVYLTLGVLLMRVAARPLARFYCLAMAMLVTLLVGTSRVYLGVHYPTDVLAGWIMGLTWALLCWTVERALERRAGLKRQQPSAG